MKFAKGRTDVYPRRFESKKTGKLEFILCRMMKPVGCRRLILTRKHRLHHNKKEVLIFDYFDNEIPVASRMFKRRCSGYKAIGYEIDYNDDAHQKTLF